MSYSRRSRYSRSPSPDKRYSRSISRSLSRSRSVSGSRSRSPSRDVENPGNNLYVTGLSPRITKRELEKHFASEGKVIDVHLVVDPWTRESRGFGFVTMETVEEADHCVKYLNRSVLEGRVITVEKARRRRGRTPTPGRYLGLRTIRVRRRSSSYSARRSPSYSPYRRSYGRSPCYSSDRSRSRSYSPYYRRRRSCSPYYSRRRSYSRSRSPYGRSLDDQYYRGRDRSYSPYYRRQRSYSPCDSRYDLLDDRYYRRYRHRSVSRSLTPPRGRRSYSRSPTPKRRRSRRSYSRSMSPRARRSYSRSVSCTPKKSVSHGGSSKYRNSRDSYSVSYSRSRSSRSVSRSVSPSSGSPSA